jgi:hypothetical protein
MSVGLRAEVRSTAVEDRQRIGRESWKSRYIAWAVRREASLSAAVDTLHVWPLSRPALLSRLGLRIEADPALRVRSGASDGAPAARESHCALPLLIEHLSPPSLDPDGAPP